MAIFCKKYRVACPDAMCFTRHHVFLQSFYSYTAIGIIRCNLSLTDFSEKVQFFAAVCHIFTECERRITTASYIFAHIMHKGYNQKLVRIMLKFQRSCGIIRTTGKKINEIRLHFYA